jgi:hypothetical protein
MRKLLLVVAAALVLALVALLFSAPTPTPCAGPVVVLSEPVATLPPEPDGPLSRYVPMNVTYVSYDGMLQQRTEDVYGKEGNVTFLVEGHVTVGDLFEVLKQTPFPAPARSLLPPTMIVESWGAPTSVELCSADGVLVRWDSWYETGTREQLAAVQRTIARIHDVATAANVTMMPGGTYISAQLRPPTEGSDAISLTPEMLQEAPILAEALEHERRLIRVPNGTNPLAIIGKHPVWNGYVPVAAGGDIYWIYGHFYT